MSLLHNVQEKRVLTLFSPAKLNLFFAVLGKREDAYHEIFSLNQTISLGDTLTFELSCEDRLTCNDPAIPIGPSNLILKALELFRAHTGFTHSVQIHLDKKIPVEAGLGGGSSNAATLLFAINELSGLKVPEEDLKLLGANIGMDVPFFFSCGTAVCSGRGEVIQNVREAALSKKLWIAKPQMGLSTPLVYQHVVIPHHKHDLSTVLEEALRGEGLFNDLERAAFSALPELHAYKESLLALGFSQVIMTGSGTAFMCFTEEEIRPFLKGSQFYPVRYIQRSLGQWYK